MGVDRRRVSGVEYRVQRFVQRRNGSLKLWRWEAPTYRTGNFGFRLVRVNGTSQEVLTEVRYGAVTRSNAHPFTAFQADVMKGLRRLRKDLKKAPLGYSPEQHVTPEGLLEIQLVKRELSDDPRFAKTKQFRDAMPSHWSCPGIKKTVLESERFDPERDAESIKRYLADVAAEARERNREARHAADQQAGRERQTADSERMQAEAAARKRAAAEKLKTTLSEAMKDFDVHDVA